MLHLVGLFHIQSCKHTPYVPPSAHSSEYSREGYPNLIPHLYQQASITIIWGVMTQQGESREAK